MNNQYIDITLALHSDLPVWPGDPLAMIKQFSTIKNGDGDNSSRIQSSLHWGTHVDAPYHIIENGWTIDRIPLDVLIGPAQVIEIANGREITATHLNRFDIKQCKRLLVKTRNSTFWDESPLKFHRDFTAFTKNAAEYLLECGVRLIGIDYLSLDVITATDLSVHHLLYEQNVVGVEGLDLREVSPGSYQLICLPLNIMDGDGAPARVILTKNSR
jgi:arylformamidase